MDSASAQRVGMQVEALLFEPLLQSLFPDSGPLGGYGRGELAFELARADSGGFGAILERALEAHR